MKKNVFFYKIYLDYLPMFENSNNFAKIISSFEINKALKIKDTNAVIDFIKINSEYCFGSLGKLEDFNKKPLVRSRSKEDLNDKSDITEMSDYIEQFSYFCIDLNNLNCAVLNNYNSLSFKKHFRNLLLASPEMKESLNDCQVIDYIRDDMTKEIGKLNQVLKLDYSFNNDQIVDNKFLPFNELVELEHSDITKATISLNLSLKDKPRNFVNKISEAFQIKKDFTTFKLQDDNRTIDLIEDMFTQKIQISLTNDELKNTNLIFTELVEKLKLL